MSTTSSPFGFVPSHATSGFIRPTTIGGPGANGIDPAYATLIPQYAPVQMRTNGVLNVGGTTGALYGIFAGCQYKIPSSGQAPVGFITLPYWPAGGVPNATEVTAFVYTAAQNVEFTVQANGPIPATALGDQANCVNPGAATAQGFSTAGLNSTLIGAGNTAQFTIIRIAQDSTPSMNTAGDAFTEVVVRLNQSQIGPASVVAI